MNLVPAHFYLACAIIAEVIGTTTLKATDGFTKPLPLLVVAISYCTAFYFMSLTLKTFSIGVTYAIWCAGGIILISAAGWIIHKQALDLAAILGLAMIIAGVAVIYLFSKTVAA